MKDFMDVGQSTREGGVLSSVPVRLYSVPILQPTPPRPFIQVAHTPLPLERQHRLTVRDAKGSIQYHYHFQDGGRCFQRVLTDRYPSNDSSRHDRSLDRIQCSLEDYHIGSLRNYPRECDVPRQLLLENVPSHVSRDNRRNDSRSDQSDHSSRRHNAPRDSRHLLFENGPSDVSRIYGVSPRAYYFG